MATSKMTRTVVEAIVAANYMADEEQIAQLVTLVTTGEEAEQCYFRVLLAHMQSRLGTTRRSKQPPQEPVLDAIHEAFYPLVLEAVGPEEMPKDERNRKATKYRTAASTIRYFIRHGGDVRTVDVSTVTKNGLRRTVQPAQAEPEGETRAERSFRRAETAIVRMAQRLVKVEPSEARERIEAVLEALEGILGQIPEDTDIGGQTTTIVSGRGTPGRASHSPAMLHRGPTP